MSDIRIDLDRLETTHSDVVKVVSSFTSTEQLGSAAANAAGHPNVEFALHEFVDGWSVRRGELAEELQFIADALKAIHDTFVELDTELADKAEQLAPIVPLVAVVAPGGTK